MRVDNLTDPKAPVDDIKTRLLVVETQAPLGYSSVTDGQIRIASPQGLWVEGEGGIRLDGRMDADGIIDVTGTITVKGRDGGSGGVFTAEGTNTLSGTNLLSGPTRVTGTFDIEGATTITGAVGISGDFTSTGNVILNGTTRLNGNSFVTGQLTITGATKVQSSFEALGDTTLGGALTISGATVVNNTFRTNGAVTVAGSITVTGSASFQSTLTISGAASLSSTLTVSGAIVSGGVRIENNQIKVETGGNSTTINASGITSSYASINRIWLYEALFLPGVAQITDLQNSDEWLIRRGNQVYAVPQSVGGPMSDFWWQFDPNGPQMTDEFGMRVHPITGENRLHAGIDFSGPAGTPIKAIGRGTVIEVGTNPGAGFGYYVMVQHAGGITSTYAHLESTPPVSVGQTVAQKQVIGSMGTTGTSTGVHLHLQVEKDGVPVNPTSIITKPYVAE